MPLLALALALSAGLHTSSAIAHDFRDTRRVVLQIDAHEALLLVSITVPKGSRATLLRTMHDVNRDGQLDDEEVRALAASLSPDAMAGLQLCRDDEVLQASSLDWRLQTRVGLSEPIELWLLLSFDGGPGLYELSNLNPPHDHTHGHGHDHRQQHVGLSAELEVGVGLELVTANRIIANDGLGLPAQPLDHQQTLVFVLRVTP
jgi:hypothetical protein